MPKGRNAEVDDEDIVEALRGWPRDGTVEVYPSTSTVRDEIEEEYGVDYNRKTLYRRLDSLESNGEISKIQVGEGRGKSVGWYATPTTPEIETEPRDHGGDGQPPRNGENPDLEAKTTSSGGMDLPGVMALLILGAVGWFAVKNALEWALDTDSDLIGAIWFTLTAAGTVATVGYIALSAYVAYTGAQAGLVMQAVSAGIGLLILVAAIYKWGMVGASAKASKAVITRLSGESK